MEFVYIVNNKINYCNSLYIIFIVFLKFFESTINKLQICISKISMYTIYNYSLKQEHVTYY
jgi:hypothetical protein